MSNSNLYVVSGSSPPALQIALDLLVFLRTQTGPLTEKQILKSVKGRTQFKVAALRLLLLDGTLVRSGLGKTNQPYTYQVSNSSSAPSASGELSPLPNISPLTGAQEGTSLAPTRGNQYQLTKNQITHRKEAPVSLKPKDCAVLWHWPREKAQTLDLYFLKTGVSSHAHLY